VFLGVLLMTHTVYVLPLVVATVVGWAVDLARGRRAPLGLRDTLVVAGTALVVSAAYWLPVAVLRVSGRPTDTLQLRWSPRGFDVPPLPIPVDPLGALTLVALVWVLTRIRSDRMVQQLAIVLLGGYAVALGGQLLQPLDVAVLPHKAHRLITAVLVAATVAALVAVCREVVRRHSTGRPRATVAAVGLVAVVVAVPVAVGHHRYWSTSDLAAAAHETRYPDGSYPDDGVRDVGRPPSDRRLDAWDVRAGDPSMSEVLAAWRRVSARGPEADSGTVLLTVRGDLLATRPVHGFTSWKSIYSHPNGQFEARVDMLREMERCPDPECAARMLTDNPFDRIHGVVVRRSGDDLVLPLGIDNFPVGWDYIELRIPERLLRGPLFTREDVGTVVVAAVGEPDGA
jgi:galactan 5-O-arabinofuranosyltransferase